MKPTEQLFTAIARKHLFIETLESQNSDRLDFHDVSVRGVQYALAEAYQAGKQSAQDLLRAAELVIARWETGDLAEAVRMLSEAVELAGDS
jgi:hypothetical protein